MLAPRAFVQRRRAEKISGDGRGVGVVMRSHAMPQAVHLWQVWEGARGVAGTCEPLMSGRWCRVMRTRAIL